MGKKISFKEAKEHNDKRPQKERLRDNARWSRDIAYDYKWKKNPHKYDYPNVDTPQTSDTEIKKRISDMKERKKIRYARDRLVGRSVKLDKKTKRIPTKGIKPFRGYQSPTNKMSIEDPVVKKYNLASGKWSSSNKRITLLSDTKLHKLYAPKNIINEYDIVKAKNELLRTAKVEINALRRENVHTEPEIMTKKINMLVKKHRFGMAFLEQKEGEILGSFEETNRKE